MKQIIRIDAVVKDKEQPLDIILDDEIITIELNGKKICDMDYDNNFKPAMQKMLETWK